MIIAKIDLNKFERDPQTGKAKFFLGKNGEKYVDVILIDTPNSQYGNSHMVVQGVSKEEREAGKKGPILGNAKIVGQTRPKPPTPKRDNPPADGPDDDVPF